MYKPLKIRHETIDPRTGEKVIITRDENGTESTTKAQEIEKLRIAAEKAQLNSRNQCVESPLPAA